MNCLVVVAHPLPQSLCKTLADQAVATLKAAGQQVVVEDLYQAKFNASLTALERLSYYGPRYDSTGFEGQAQRLLAAEAIVLVFPTWWFGFPAILKGWFDRVWGPGIAYDHAADYGPIKPRLLRLRKMLAVTTLGSPWWVDRVVMRQPVKRVLKNGILQACAPQCAFDLLSFYKTERLTEDQVRGFKDRVAVALKSWA